MIVRTLRTAWILVVAGCLIALVGHTTHGQETADKLPAKPQTWRGVHVMAWGLAGGPEGLAPLKEAVAKVLAPLGVNVIVLEVGYNFAYKSHPELTQTKFITKADARDLVRFCRGHGVRVVPQFNCLGHQSWRHTLYPLLTQYRELEEPPDDTPDKRWTELRSWCPLHPQVNPIVFALMDELIDAFEADAFHVGMDEVLVIASKKCERCREKSPAEVFAKAVNDYHRHLVGEKKVAMLMWGDRLIDANVMKYDGWSASKNGTAPAVDLIPKDIIICDWHYEKRADYPSVRYFQDKGFRIWPAGWNNVDATRALIACARRNATDRMIGHLSTTWVLEPGGFARALLGERDAALVSERAIQSAAACREAMEEVAKPPAGAATQQTRASAQSGQSMPSHLPPGKKWKLVWSDEFNGAELDRAKWDFRLYMMHQRHKTWTDDAASLDGKGNVLLRAYEKNGDYYSSQLQTGSNYMDRPPDGRYSKQFQWPIARIAPARFMHKYGYYEIRCQLPKQPGWWAAFWLQSPTIGSTLDPGRSGVEIDIMENFTRDGVISHNIHWNGYGKDHRGKGSGPVKRPELSEGYHTFGLEWNAKEYVFYTDGIVTWRADGPISHREQFLLISTECNGYRQGGPAPELEKAKLPDSFIVDYVRVFDEVRD